MIEIRFHGRGGQGAITASRLIAEAVAQEGKYAQAIPMYGTERRGAPVTAYVRIDDRPVRRRDLVHEPDIVIVIDPILSTKPSVAAGLKQRGLLLLNYPKPPEEVEIGGDFMVTTIDATTIALETLGRPITNTAVLGAFSRVTGITRLESLEKAILERFPGEIGERNVKALRRAYEEVYKLTPAKGHLRPMEEEPPHVTGYGVLKSVADWRIFKPAVDLDRCISCRFCWIYCPETAITLVDEKPLFDYDRCKGCGICVHECPVKAIEFVRETV